MKGIGHPARLATVTACAEGHIAVEKLWNSANRAIGAGASAVRCGNLFTDWVEYVTLRRPHVPASASLSRHNVPRGAICLASERLSTAFLNRPMFHVEHWQIVRIPFRARAWRNVPRGTSSTGPVRFPPRGAFSIACEGRIEAAARLRPEARFRAPPRSLEFLLGPNSALSGAAAVYLP
jgi:hypothetical protein